MFDAESLSDLSDAELVGELQTWSARVAAGEARVLALVGELDRREAWSGFSSCAHWLSHWLGLGMKAARERVRIARALRGLPLIEGALASGQMSYAQVRAATRVATQDQQQLWIDLAGQASGGQLERLVRGVRRGQCSAEAAQDRETDEWRRRSRISYDEDGMLVITMRLNAEEGAVALAGIDQARDVLDARLREARSEASAEASEERLPRSTFTDGVLHLLTRGAEDLSRQHPRVARRHRMKLAVHVDPLSGCGRLADGEFLVPDAVARIAGPAPAGKAPELDAHDQGRSSREPSERLRDLLGAVDGHRCRFPGCDRRRRLHAHHVRWWAKGGRTDLANLLFLCTAHHVQVHQDAWRLDLAADRSLSVTARDGTRLLHHPGRPQASAEALPGRAVDDLRCGLSGQALDLHYAVGVIVQQAA